MTDIFHSDDDLAFRKEIRSFIEANLPSELRERLRAGFFAKSEDIRNWQRILARHGYAAPSWPAQYGGPGWTPTQQFIFMDEIFRAPAPEPFILNANVAGPLIIKFGTEELKQRLLPGMLTADIWFCIGMSEPEAGSDLAALRTSASREGDEYVINGEKIWTSSGHDANWMVCFVRTDSSGPRQQGITVLLVEMDTPGIQIRPIRSLDHRHHFNSVFFDNVRVPVANRVGEENKGWTYAKAGLGDERLGIARVGMAAERLEYAAELARNVQRDGEPLSDRADFRRRVALLDVETKVLEVMQMRALHQAAAGVPLGNTIPSMLKILGSELYQATSELVLDAAGPAALEDSLGQQRPANPSLPGWGAGYADTYFYSRAATIYGGSTEIQKNIIARFLAP